MQTAAPMKYLEKAMTTIRDLGLSFQVDTQAPAAALVQSLEVIDEGKAVVIARTLQQASHFNALVRDEIGGVTVSDRYQEISDAFTSIRDDAKRMVAQLDDGKITLIEKASNVWMSVARGSIPSRFNKVRSVYLDVTRDTKEQIDREGNILTAYLDFRLALKEAEILANELLAGADQRVTDAKSALEVASKAADEASDDDMAAKGRLQLARDEALRVLQDEDARYQVAKDLRDNLTVAYSTSDVVMARLKQMSDVKKRVYQQAVSFFSTNETVFTALNSTFTSQQGLNESTQTLEAMKDGVNRGLESLAEQGDKILSEGVAAGYGATIQAASVQKLVDAVVEFQVKTTEQIMELRQQATDNSNEIANAVEQGKKRYEALVQKGPAVAVASKGEQ